MAPGEPKNPGRTAGDHVWCAQGPRPSRAGSARAMSARLSAQEERGCKMKTASEHERQLVRYLLGLLSPQDEEQLEERYFKDPALQEEIEATADDLIHSYLSGGLSAEERERFDAHFLASPAQRERLELV